MEMRSSAFQGEITSPGFGGEHDYRDQLNCSYTVEVPENLKEMIGTNGVLVIQLLVDTKEKEEYITINRGPSLLHIEQKKATWEDAETYCLEKGGHLFSVLSASDKQELDDRLLYVSADNYHLGARRKNGTWKWSDGSPWNDTAFPIISSPEDNGDCLMTRSQL